MTTFSTFPSKQMAGWRGVFFAACLLLGAVSGAAPASASIDLSGISLPPSVTITSDKASATSGDQITLTVTALGVTSCSLGNNVPITIPSGGGLASVTVTITKTTTYTVTCTGSDGSTLNSSVTVLAVGSPISSMGSSSNVTLGTVYHAATDGFLSIPNYCSTGSYWHDFLQTSSSASGTFTEQQHDGGYYGIGSGMVYPIQKGTYWKIGSNTAGDGGCVPTWTPISGTSIGALGALQTKIAETVYQAPTDGFAILPYACNGAPQYWHDAAFVGSSAASLVEVQHSGGYYGIGSGLVMPVQAGQYWKIAGTNGTNCTGTPVYWMPIGSGTAALDATQTMAANTTYQAPTDGFVTGLYSCGGEYWHNYIKTSTDGVTFTLAQHAGGYYGEGSGMIYPVQKGTYWRFEGCTTVSWIPFYGPAPSAGAASAAAPIVSLTASPTTLKSGDPSTLTWSAQNVAACTSTNFDAGTVKNVSGTFSLTLSGGNNPDLNALAKASGWDGKSPLKVTIPSGAVIGSSDPAVAAIDTSSLPANTSLYLINQGSILGAGGKGADVTTSKIATGAAGGPGGAGIKATMPMTINNTGTIRGGGGGGGAGSGNTCGECYDDPGGTGGGGAGSNGGIAGTLGTAFLNQFGNRLTSATNGTVTTGGTGGIVCGHNGGSAECGSSGNGGNGGAPEQPGSPGLKSNAGPGGPGGAPGVKIIGTNFVTYGTVPDVAAENGLSGSLVVKPPKTTTYTLNCTGLDGSSVTKSVTINVDAAQPPTLSFYPDGNIFLLLSGQSTNLNWSSTNADSCTLSGLSGGAKTVGTTGKTSTGPLTAPTSAYSMTCANSASGASVTKLVTISVNQPSAHIYSSSDRVKAGDKVTINWDAQNVFNCTLEGADIGGAGVNTKTVTATNGTISGSTQVTITAATKYYIHCSPSVGASSSSDVQITLAPNFQEF